MLIADLWATQPQILLDALVRNEPPVGSDPLPHVIEHSGRLYLEDGHHRVMRAALAGRRSIDVRYLVMN